MQRRQRNVQKKREMHVQSWLLLISCRSRYVQRRHCLSSLFLVALDQIPCCRACKSLTSFYLSGTLTLYIVIRDFKIQRRDGNENVA